MSRMAKFTTAGSGAPATARATSFASRTVAVSGIWGSVSVARAISICLRNQKTPRAGAGGAQFVVYDSMSENMRVEPAVK
jgi:hypothetical protein